MYYLSIRLLRVAGFFWEESKPDNKEERLRPIHRLIVAAAVCLGLTFAIRAAHPIIIDSYMYDTDSSYEYDFRDCNCSVSNAEVVGGKLKELATWKMSDTAFLALNVKATFLGRFVPPRLELYCGAKKVVEALERNASGIRYINISSLLTDSSDEIHIIPNLVHVKDQSVKLYLFKNIDIRSKKVLVIAPHPDDAEIAAFDTYCKSGSTRIVTVTAGESGDNDYGDFYPSPAEAYVKKGKLRVWNSIAVPLMCSKIEPGYAVNLGYFDGTLAKMYFDPDHAVRSVHTNLSDMGVFRRLNPPPSELRSGATPTWGSLVSDLRWILEKFRPDIIITPYPALDIHPDHKCSTVALFQAIKELGIQDGMFYLYVNDAEIRSYPHGGMRTDLSLPPHFGNPLFFRSLVSNELTVSEQTDKLFALEAMNDLRIPLDARDVYNSSRVFIQYTLRNHVHKEYDYFRSAVRSNELFFVVPVRDIYDEQICARIIGKLRKP